MRNLYSRLGIEPSASEHQIRCAVAGCSNSTLKADGLEVLLNPSRRTNYDRAHYTLSDIGTLRAHLGLNHGDNWRSPESDDYTTSEPTHGLSLDGELIAKIKQLNKMSEWLEPTNYKEAIPKGNARKPELFEKGLRLIFVFCGIIGLILFFSARDDSSSSSKAPQKSYSAPQQPAFNEPTSQQPAFNEPPLQLPLSGTIRRHTTFPEAAPLVIKTGKGSNYLVKLEDTSSGNNILDVFIRGGSTIEIEVPLGTYHLKYAAGLTWYGYEHYFGPTTGYSKAESTFRFYNDGYSVNGYTITLFQVRDGNLRTSQLAPKQF